MMMVGRVNTVDAFLSSAPDYLGKREVYSHVRFGSSGLSFSVLSTFPASSCAPIYAAGPIQRPAPLCRFKDWVSQPQHHKPGRWTQCSSRRPNHKIVYSAAGIHSPATHVWRIDPPYMMANQVRVWADGLPAETVTIYSKPRSGLMHFPNTSAGCLPPRHQETRKWKSVDSARIPASRHSPRPDCGAFRRISDTCPVRSASAHLAPNRILWVWATVDPAVQDLRVAISWGPSVDPIRQRCRWVGCVCPPRPKAGYSCEQNRDKQRQRGLPNSAASDTIIEVVMARSCAVFKPTISSNTFLVALCRRNFTRQSGSFGIHPTRWCAVGLVRRVRCK